VARKRQADLLLTLSDAERTALWSTIDKLTNTIGNGDGEADAE